MQNILPFFFLAIYVQIYIVFSFIYISIFNSIQYFFFFKKVYIHIGYTYRYLIYIHIGYICIAMFKHKYWIDIYLCIVCQLVMCYSVQYPLEQFSHTKKQYPNASKAIPRYPKGVTPICFQRQHVTVCSNRWLGPIECGVECGQGFLIGYFYLFLFILCYRIVLC